MAYLFLKRTFSNIFLTLTDINKRVIVCKTSGNSGVLGTKRKKRSVFALQNIVEAMKSYFELHKINKVKIISRLKVNRYYYTLKKELHFRVFRL
jgi:ribosomal protein S11